MRDQVIAPDRSSGLRITSPGRYGAAMMDRHVEGAVEHVQGAVEQLVVRMWRGQLGGRVLGDIDYRSVLLEDASLLDGAVAAFFRNLVLRDDGEVLNYRWAEFRCAQVIRQFCDPSYCIDPPFEDFERELGFRAWFEGRAAWPKDVEYPYED
ncbi:MAG: hypothetical protein U1F60_03590 [Planctomycetota bacterium]